MTPTDLVDRLGKHKTLGRAPREELAWLVSHGTLKQLPAGGVLTPKGTQVEAMYVVLSGRLSMSVDRGAGPHKIMEWREGDITGLLPYSRMTSPPGDNIAEEASEVLAVARQGRSATVSEQPH